MNDDQERREDAYETALDAIESIKNGDARGYFIVVFDQPENATCHASYFEDNEAREEVLRGAERLPSILKRLI